MANFPKFDKFEIAQMFGQQPTAENVVGSGWLDLGLGKMYFSHTHTESGLSRVGLVGAFALLENLHLPLKQSEFDFSGNPDRPFDSILPTMWAGRILMRPSDKYTVTLDHYGLRGHTLDWAVQKGLGDCFNPNTYPISYGINDSRRLDE